MQHSRSDVSTDVHNIPFRYIKMRRDYISIMMPSGSKYDIDFDRCRTASEICNWLGQIADKTWCTPLMLGELVLAFERVNGDLHDVH